MHNKNLRFSFFCDAHVSDTVAKCQDRVLEWAVKRADELGVDRHILGGDMAHTPDPARVDLMLSYFRRSANSSVYIPGNKEGAEFFAGLKDDSQVKHIKKVERLEDWPGSAFAMPTTDVASVRSSIMELLARAPKEGHVLVLAHFHPDVLPDAEALLNPADKPGLRFSWICGHRHVDNTYDLGRSRVHIVSSVNAVKATGTRAQIAVCDWDGRELEVARENAPLQVLMPPRGLREPRLGLAYKGTPEDLLETALANDVSILQFGAIAPENATPTPRTLELSKQLRAKHPDAFLSVHLPNLDVESLDFAVMEPSFNWARSVGIADFTVHLPNMPASALYASEGVFADTPWAELCREVYLRIAREAIAHGAQLSIENGYHKVGVAPEEEKNCVRFWHLLTMVRFLRKTLLEKGYTQEQTELIGTIFDSGHAFRDVIHNRSYVLEDWVLATAETLQICHIHQVLEVDGKRVNHRGIENACGPKINYTGLLPILDEEVERRLPLVLEVRIKDEALASLRTLRRIFADSQAL